MKNNEDYITEEEFKCVIERMREEWDVTGKDVKIFLDNKLSINKSKKDNTNNF